MFEHSNLRKISYMLLQEVSLLSVGEAIKPYSKDGKLINTKIVFSNMNLFHATCFGSQVCTKYALWGGGGACYWADPQNVALFDYLSSSLVTVFSDKIFTCNYCKEIKTKIVCWTILVELRSKVDSKRVKGDENFCFQRT